MGVITLLIHTILQAIVEVEVVVVTVMMTVIVIQIPDLIILLQGDLHLHAQTHGHHEDLLTDIIGQDLPLTHITREDRHHQLMEEDVVEVQAEETHMTTTVLTIIHQIILTHITETVVPIHLRTQEDIIQVHPHLILILLLQVEVDIIVERTQLALLLGPYIIKRHHHLLLDRSILRLHQLHRIHLDIIITLYLRLLHPQFLLLHYQTRI